MVGQDERLRRRNFEPVPGKTRRACTVTLVTASCLIIVTGCGTVDTTGRQIFSERPDAETILETYAAKPHHKALTLSQTGAANWIYGDASLAEAVDRALAACDRDHGGCSLYRVGDVVVSPGADRTDGLAEARAVTGAVDAMPDGTAPELSAKIQSLINWNRPEDALLLAETWTAAAPEEGRAHAYKAWALSRLHRLDEAIAAGAQGAALAPDNAWVQFRHGTDLALAVRFDEAIQAFRRAIALRPDHDAALAGLHDLYWALGRHDAALALAEESLRARAGLVSATIRKAWSQARLAALDDALATLAAGHDALPADAPGSDRVSLWRAQAAILLHAGRIEPAVAAVAQAVRGEDEKGLGAVATEVIAARVEAASGCVEPATSGLRDLLTKARQEDRIEAGRLLARSLADMLARADAGAANAVDLAAAGTDGPGAPAEAQAIYGWALFRAGQAEAAVAPLEAARGRLPGDALVAARLGSVYQALNRMDEAEALLFEALARAPGRHAAALAETQIQGQPVPDDPSETDRLNDDACEALAARLRPAARAALDSDGPDSDGPRS